MSDAWAKALAEIAALLKKWGAAIFAFFAGRQSKAAEERLKDQKAEAEDARKKLDEEREIARRRDDDAERERVRDAYRKARPGE